MNTKNNRETKAVAPGRSHSGAKPHGYGPLSQNKRTAASAPVKRAGPAASKVPTLEETAKHAAFIQDAGLRRLTAAVLEELKKPGAVPSNIILAALKQASSMSAPLSK